MRIFEIETEEIYSADYSGCFPVSTPADLSDDNALYDGAIYGSGTVSYTHLICPNCGRKMKQQFIGLQHCKCGMSWKKDEGFLERTPDMVFALERQTIGKKVKQIPVIR